MNSHYRFWWLAGLLVFGLPTLALACLWDHDTLRQERTRFPTALELVTGKFLRHSPEFYQWRIEDRKKRIAAGESKPELYDDLAVAYEKTGQHQLAIDTMLEKEKLHPGLYETYSNLGTFHILAGDFELGLPFIDKALAINPDAHFGREKYQRWLVEYALSKRNNGALTLPLQRGGRDFEYYLALQQNVEFLSASQRQDAVTGVLGMMRFANHENPLLLEVLGDLLRGYTAQNDVNAKQLAARAYLKASLVVADSTAKSYYRNLAEDALSRQSDRPGEGGPLELALIEADFKTELTDAQMWYDGLRQAELGWIKEGKNADQEFDQLYDREPESLALPERVIPPPPNKEFWRAFWTLATFGGIVLGAAFLFWRGAVAAESSLASWQRGPESRRSEV